MDQCLYCEKRKTMDIFKKCIKKQVTYLDIQGLGGQTDLMFLWIGDLPIRKA